MEMDELTAKLEAFLAQASGEEQEVVEALESFYASNDKRADTAASSPGEGVSPDFVARFGWAARAAFVAALLGNLRATTASPAVCLAVLRVFKLCAREPQHAEDLAQLEVLELLLAFTNLDAGGDDEASRRPMEVACEALRCIVNLVQHSLATLGPQLCTSVGVGTLLRALEREVEPAYRMSLLRLVFNCSLEKSTYLPELQAFNALPITIGVLAYALDNITSGAPADGQEQVATEALRLILNLTLHLGPLVNPPNPPPKPEEVEAWKQLVPHIHRVMELGANHQRMQHFAVAVLVNTPQGCAHHFRIDCTSVDSLIDFLRRQFDHPDETQTAPVLMVLVAIAKGIPALREYMMTRCFPVQPPPLTSSKPIEPPPNWQENEIGRRLIQLMTAVNYGLKHYVNEFIFVLCDEDVDVFVRLTGLGSAAGWLATRNLFQGFQKMGSATPSSTSSSSSSSSSRSRQQAKGKESGLEDEQEEDEEYEEDELGRLRRRGPGGANGAGSEGAPTDQEEDGRDEASLLDLIDKIERLQQLGIISVMPAGDAKKKEDK